MHKGFDLIIEKGLKTQVVSSKVFISDLTTPHEFCFTLSWRGYINHGGVGSIVFCCLGITHILYSCKIVPYNTIKKIIYGVVR